MKDLMKEFKEFAIRGNVIDLAVAVVIGTAFGKITTSLVSDVIMPLFSAVLGGVDFTDRAIAFGGVAITYGVFVQSIIEFVVIALAIFLFVKGLSTLKKRLQAQETEVEAEKIPSEEVLLLREIRDALRKKLV